MATELASAGELALLETGGCDGQRDEKWYGREKSRSTEDIAVEGTSKTKRHEGNDGLQSSVKPMTGSGNSLT